MNAAYEKILGGRSGLAGLLILGVQDRGEAMWTLASRAPGTHVTEQPQ